MSAADPAPDGADPPDPAVAAILARGADEDFRAGLRDWLAAALAGMTAALPGEAAMHTIAFRRRWEDHLCRAGWSGLSWPADYGGHGLSLLRQVIFHEEYARSGAPLPVNLIGHGILAPTLLLHGSAAQKQRFLPPLRLNREIWCQGYSEPGAGSDLAALQTRAVREGDVYRIRGHKIWTSFADIADWCFVLARTDADAPKHKGISFLLVPMKGPGVRVRPIRQMTGEADYNEVFFDDVVVPVANRVGAEGEGWRIAMAAASFERGTYFAPRIVRMQAELEAVVRLAATRAGAAGRAIDDPVVRDRIGRLVADLHALRLAAQRLLAQAIRGDAPGAEGSCVKLLWSESHQRLLDLAADLLGPAIQYGPQEPAAPREGRWSRDFLWTRAETILAGTSEIMRNIVAERALGLPR